VAAWPYSTAQWQALRLAKLRLTPHCEYCLRFFGRVVAARAVDHIKPVAAGGDPFPPLAGLRALCASHHNEKTSRFDRPDRKASTRAVKGHDLGGNPFADPNW
jgi:5-methylcytosine-specific restriction enzyme A